MKIQTKQVVWLVAFMVIGLVTMACAQAAYFVPIDRFLDRRDCIKEYAYVGQELLGYHYVGYGNPSTIILEDGGRQYRLPLHRGYELTTDQGVAMADIKFENTSKGLEAPMCGKE